MQITLILPDEVAKQIRELPNPDQFVNNAIQEALKKLRLETITQRVAGLGEQSIWVSDDFDEPLPEKFWLSDKDQ